MLFLDGIALSKVGNGTGDLENARIGAGREAEAISDQLRHTVAAGVQFAMFFDEAGCHLGVAVNFCSIGVTEPSIWNWEHGTEPELQYNPRIIKFLGWLYSVRLPG